MLVSYCITTSLKPHHLKLGAV